MPTSSRYLAVDLGADSGRLIAGRYDWSLISIEEIHRFPNGGVKIGSSLHWDVLRLWTEIQAGMRKAAHEYSQEIASIGLDTWGVDFALLGKNDTLLGNPYTYRDSRTNGMVERAFAKVPREEIYRQTGIQSLQINSLYQLLAMVANESPLLPAAETLFMIPDLFNFWLSGKKASEFSIATTSQCYNPVDQNWAFDLLERLSIPTRIFQPIIRPGCIIGPVQAEVAAETGCPDIPVVAVGSHDTASAVAAVPAAVSDFVYISSGTWSVIGVELDHPILTSVSPLYEFTNEGGVCNTFRYSTNLMGMWPLQESRRDWARAGREYSYDELTGLAEEAAPFRSMIVPSDVRFLPPGDMIGRIQQYCAESGQPVPETPGQIVRCILESLALAYKEACLGIEENVGRPFPVVHIIGGGSRNKLLNQMTADSTGKEVVAGPVEATAVGNILLQALALGHIQSLAEGREIVRRSSEVNVYQPIGTPGWDFAYQNYLSLKNR